MDTLDRTASEPELRRLIDAYDWSASPVGEPSGWPQSLRTALGICLSSRFPMIIFWGPELVQFYNDAYAPILGARHPRALGQRARDCWPEIWDAIGPMLSGVLERGEATWSENLLLPLERNGAPEELYFTFSYSPIADGNRVGGVFCAVAETTAFVLREREAQAQVRALAELDRAKTEFFNNVSHEFRTPLTLILGPLEERLRVAAQSDPALADDLTLMRRNARRLLRLVNTLLDFNRLEAQRLDVQPVAIDPARFTAEVASTFRSAMEAAGLRYEVEAAPLGTAMLDLRLWESIVLNLISNALKFTLAGSVTVRLTRVGDLLQLAVHDTGVGAAQPERVFDRFWRAEGQSGRSHEGSGIGLALVRAIAELHGGSATFESEVGRGSVATVSIPFVGAAGAVADAPVPLQADLFVDEASAWTGPSRKPPASRRPVGTRPRILVVDDNADLRAYVARLLDEMYEVAVARDALDAIAEIGQRLPDVVVCDVMMPGLDGIAFVRRLRNDPPTRELPIILLSARSDHGAAASALAAGADAYLTKPFVGAELLVQIERRVTRALAKREEEARFRAIADEVAQIMYTHAPDGSLEWANARWYEYSQLPEHLALNIEGWAEVVEPGDLRRALTLIEAAFRQQIPYEAEMRIRPRGANEDAYRWHLLRAVPMRSGDGTIVRWAGSGTDVHDHRTSEARVRDELEQQLAREHRTSLAFQTAALPKRLPVVAGLHFDALYVAAEKESFVGGDWYDAFRLDDGRILVSVGDVMGSGLDAAVTMGAVRQAIRGAAQLYPDPSSILDAADRALRLEQPERIVTAFIGIIDPMVESLTYASAGHPSPLMRGPDGAVRALGFVDLPLGLRDLRSVTTASAVTALRPGSTLVLYTDGLTESTHDVIEGERRLTEALADGIDQPAAIRDRVAARTFDDVALLVVRVGSAERPRWREPFLDAVAYARLRADVMGALSSSGLSAGALADAELVIGELLGNVVRHAPDAPVDVTLDLHGPEPVLHVADRGPGFTFNARLPNDMMSESGRGLFIAARLAREFSVTRRAHGGSRARVVLGREPV